MPRFLLAFTLFASALALSAQEAAPMRIEGRIEGRNYISPTGLFKVTIPVLPELGGEITDTPNVVTFQDNFNVHVSIAAFPQDATQRWELTTRGLKDYLVYFFSNFVLSDFRSTFEGVEIESANFVPNMLGGSLITHLLVPNGSMFADRVMQFGPSDRVFIAKRGNLLFVRNGHIMVISIELAERVIEGSTYKKTVAEENEILLERLNDIVAKIEFARPPASAAPVPATKQ